MVWADDPAEIVEKHPGAIPKSFTFIAATLDDNPTLNQVDPGYRANLMALPLVERERLLGGNWLIRPAAGMYFRRGWCPLVDAVPANLNVVRGWDLASTRADGLNDPDWTCGTKMGRAADGRYFLLDHVWMRGSPHEVERLIRNTAVADGPQVMISVPEDPGQAGKAQAQALVKMLAGFRVTATRETGDKITRFGPFSAQAEAGNVEILRGAWNERLMTQLEGFPEGAHDDDADSTARAFNALLALPPVMRFSDEALERAARPDFGMLTRF
jgi:predicted phage terminase large subunit-like protein